MAGGGGGGGIMNYLGNATGQPGGSGGQDPPMAAGSPGATQADIQRLQQAQQAQAQPVFGAGGDDAGRAQMLQQMLGARQGGQGPTGVRKSAQPVMGGGGPM